MNTITQTGEYMITNKMIAKALESFIENFDENEKYLQGQRELRAECEARHKRLEEQKKQALTNEHNFNCGGC